MQEPKQERKPVLADKSNLKIIEENKTIDKILKEFLGHIAKHILDPTVQKIFITKNKKNDQLFLSIARHPKIKHKLSRALRIERDKLRRKQIKKVGK